MTEGQSEGPLETGVFVAPLVEPGYILIAIRYAFAGPGGAPIVTPMAGLILELSVVPILLGALADLQAEIERCKVAGFPKPFLCAELGYCFVSYSVATQIYVVALGVVAGCFRDLRSLSEPLEATYRAIQQKSPWPAQAPEWLQRFSAN